MMQDMGGLRGWMWKCGEGQRGVSAGSGGGSSQIGAPGAFRNRSEAGSPGHMGRWSAKDWTAVNTGNTESLTTVPHSPEIMSDDVQVGLEGSRPVQARIDDPSTG